MPAPAEPLDHLVGERIELLQVIAEDGELQRLAAHPPIGEIRVGEATPGDRTQVAAQFFHDVRLGEFASLRSTRRTNTLPRLTWRLLEADGREGAVHSGRACRIVSSSVRRSAV